MIARAAKFMQSKGQCLTSSAVRQLADGNCQTACPCLTERGESVGPISFEACRELSALVELLLKLKRDGQQPKNRDNSGHAAEDRSEKVDCPAQDAIGKFIAGRAINHADDCSQRDQVKGNAHFNTLLRQVMVIVSGR